MRKCIFLSILIASVLLYSKTISAQPVKYENDSVVFQFDKNKNFRTSINDAGKTIIINQKGFDLPVIFEKTVNFSSAKFPENVIFYNVHFKDYVGDYDE